MKLSLSATLFLLASFSSLSVAVPTASDYYYDNDNNMGNDNDRMLGFFGRGGGGGGGMRRPPFDLPERTVLLDCSSSSEAVVPCTPHRRRPHYSSESDASSANGGMYVCIQHPQDETKAMTVCMETTDDDQDNDAAAMVFSADDDCGCCGGTCPTSCAEVSNACTCSGTNRDGIDFDGYAMTMTRRGWLFGGDTTVTTCVPTDATVHAQIRGAECVTDC